MKRTKRLGAIVLAVCLIAEASAAPAGGARDRVDAAPRLRKIDWNAVIADRPLPANARLSRDPGRGTVLRIEGQGGSQEPLHLLTITDPGITQKSYKLIGEIRYDGIDAPGYLEMWNHFGKAGSYFTRTLATSGPLQRLAGSSDWRRFELPFFITADEYPQPDRLELNLVLPSGGEVEIANVALWEGPFSPWGDAAWWSPAASGWLGGVLGSLFGMLGALYGWSRATGKAWSLLHFFPRLCYTAGGGLLLAGGTAVAVGQPRFVFYPLLLVGTVLTITMAIIDWVARRGGCDAGAAAELRRMQALDAR